MCFFVVVSLQFICLVHRQTITRHVHNFEYCPRAIISEHWSVVLFASAAQAHKTTIPPTGSTAFFVHIFPSILVVFVPFLFGRWTLYRCCFWFDFVLHIWCAMCVACGTFEAVQWTSTGCELKKRGIYGILIEIRCDMESEFIVRKKWSTIHG